MKKLLFILLYSVLLLSGCKNVEQDVNDSVIHFYKNHQPNYRNVDRKLLSKELNLLLDKTDAREKLELKWTAKSASPTDKPQFIETDIFASHLEGEFGFAVNKISVNGVQARIIMDFTSTLVPTNDVQKWSEEVILINEDGWKFDDINFPKDGCCLDYHGTLKNALTSFINMPTKEHHPAPRLTDKAAVEANSVKK
jgi:hypothetical protein